MIRFDPFNPRMHRNSRKLWKMAGEWRRSGVFCRNSPPTNFSRGRVEKFPSHLEAQSSGQRSFSQTFQPSSSAITQLVGEGELKLNWRECGKELLLRAPCFRCSIRERCASLRLSPFSRSIQLLLRCPYKIYISRLLKIKWIKIKRILKCIIRTFFS